ncbi:hypothetical protein ccbrp13_62910 [Ktedonobacteria bacterium brp13]|nr:hypothetical protein ccbrp13_62910 [Ktedonobacteria bacterium brp13]
MHKTPLIVLPQRVTVDILIVDMTPFLMEITLIISMKVNFTIVMAIIVTTMVNW